MTRLRKEKGETIVTESDHNPIFTEFDISVKNTIKSERIELFNYRNVECQKEFKTMSTNTTNFTNIFDNNDTKDINQLGDKFLKELNKMSHQCFKKIRINKISKKKKKKSEVDILFEKKKTFEKI